MHLYIYSVAFIRYNWNLFFWLPTLPPLLLGSTKDSYVFLIYCLGKCGKECIVIVRWGIVYRVFHFSKLLAPK